MCITMVKHATTTAQLEKHRSLKCRNLAVEPVETVAETYVQRRYETRVVSAGFVKCKMVGFVKTLFYFRCETSFT